MTSLSPKADLIARGLDVLDCFHPSRPEWGITELAVTLGMTKSRVHRIVQTMESKRYLQRNPATRRYRLGVRSLEIGSAAAQTMDEMGLLRGLLDRFAAGLDATMAARLRDGSEIVFLDGVESSGPVRVTIEHAARRPIYYGAMGLAICATLSDEELDAVLPRNALIRWSPKSFRTAQELREFLPGVRAAGYAVSDERVQMGVLSIGACLRNPAGRAIGAISARFPTGSLPDDISAIGARVIEAAKEASALVNHFAALGIEIGSNLLRSAPRA